MSKPFFRDCELAKIDPPFDSPVTDLVIELEKLRVKRLEGTTYPSIFFQLKHIFHALESLGSARIEGNNTTIAEYIETKINVSTSHDEPSIMEIKNIERAMEFIETNVMENPIDRAFISEMHKILVNGLSHHDEGDLTPGWYRKKNLKISNSDHLPPDWTQVDGYMKELIEYINMAESPKYDLLRVARAHHRFVWIHPFGNGNGRTVRLLTYAMLVKLGFNVSAGRILNPTAIFCNDRDQYYKYLSLADSGENDQILKWCEYVLKGLRDEIEKIDRLLDYEYLKREILMPTLTFSLERKYITDIEFKVLKRAVDKEVIQASDLKDIFTTKISTEVSRQIKKLRDKNMLQSITAGGNKYVICFENSYLLRGVFKSLDDKGFINLRDKEDTSKAKIKAR